MADWKERIRHQINQSADEIKASAFDTLTASPLIKTAKITILLDPEKAPEIQYDIDVYPRSILKQN